MYSLKLEMEGVSSAMVSAGPESVPTLPEPLVLRLQNGNAVPAAQGAGKDTWAHAGSQQGGSGTAAFLGSWPGSLPVPRLPVEDTRLRSEMKSCAPHSSSSGQVAALLTPSPNPRSHRAI